MNIRANQVTTTVMSISQCACYQRDSHTYTLSVDWVIWCLVGRQTPGWTHWGISRCFLPCRCWEIREGGIQLAHTCAGLEKYQTTADLLAVLVMSDTIWTHNIFWKSPMQVRSYSPFKILICWKEFMSSRHAEVLFLCECVFSNVTHSKSFMYERMNIMNWKHFPTSTSKAISRGRTHNCLVDM